MSKKLEKILDQKFEKFIKGIDTLINDIKVLKKDESHKIILLRQDLQKIQNNFNSTVATWNKYLDSIENRKLSRGFIPPNEELVITNINPKAIEKYKIKNKS